MGIPAYSLNSSFQSLGVSRIRCGGGDGGGGLTGRLGCEGGRGGGAQGW